MPPPLCMLFYLLLQVPEAIRVEKFLYGNIQPVAYLFDGGNGGAVVAARNYIIEGGLGYAADGGKLVY